MNHAPTPARNRPNGLVAALFGRKASAPPAPAVDPRVVEFQAWPWVPVHDTAAAPFGPLTPHATTGKSGNWRMERSVRGLRLHGNTDPSSAITVGGSIAPGMPGCRITAEIYVRRLRGDGSLAALVVSAHAHDRLIMGLLSDGDLIVFRMRGTDTEIIGQCPLAPHPSGEAARLTLQAMLFEENAILFANGQYLGTVTDKELVGESAGTGFQVKGDSDDTLRSLTVEGLDLTRPPPRP